MPFQLTIHSQVLADGRLRVGNESGVSDSIVVRSSLLAKEKLKSGLDLRLDPNLRVAVEIIQPFQSRFVPFGHPTQRHAVPGRRAAGGFGTLPLAGHGNKTFQWMRWHERGFAWILRQSGAKRPKPRVTPRGIFGPRINTNEHE